MYQDREQVRDVVTKVRTSEIRDFKARRVATHYQKQKATLFHDLIAQVIDEEYERIVNEERQRKRG